MKVKSILYYALITVIALLFIAPMVWMLLSSFKIDQTIYRDINSWRAFVPVYSDLTLSSYTELLSMYSIFRNIVNSLVYATISILFGLLVNSLAGYALARFSFPLKNFWIIFIIALMIVPIEATVLPLYLVVNSIGLIGTIAGLVVPFFANVMYIFLFRQYFLSFPQELSEAATVDGLGYFMIFLRIVLPVSVSIYITIGVLTFLTSWNDFLWPVMALTDSDLMTIQVALNAISSDTYHIFTGHRMASLTIATIPVVVIYAIFQKYIMEGAARSGLK